MGRACRCPAGCVSPVTGMTPGSSSGWRPSRPGCRCASASRKPAAATSTCSGVARNRCLPCLLGQIQQVATGALEKVHTASTWCHCAGGIEIMNLLYESDDFAVMHLLANEAGEGESKPARPVLERHGFEIVDKRSGKEVYLDGAWAELFQQQLQAWQQHSPTQEEVEDTLESYTGLAQQPVVVH